MKIVIVDDHVLFREGLASILSVEADIQVVGMAGSVQETIELLKTVEPEIILMDFNLPDGTGAEASHKIIQDHPNCKIVFLTMSDKDEDMFAAIRSGAKGYLLKNLSPSKLVTSLRAVVKGESAISRIMTLRVMEEFSRTKEADRKADPSSSKLTSREKDVLVELASGKTNKEIGSTLFISENTVKYFVHSILEKLNLKDRKEAAGFARDHKLVK